MISVNDFKEYKIIDMNNFEKLEDWNGVILRRPDPQIIWKKEVNKELWENVDAKYTRSNTGGGHWEIKRNIKNSWIINYKDMAFNLKLMNFKHTGLFPEQAANWNFIREKLHGTKNKKVLNLFAYTGAATIAALKEGASVVHVDSSKGMVAWAKENIVLNNLQDKNVRYIVDDVIKFVKREIRRGNKYDGIIMDPPSFGKGSSGEVWKFEKNFFLLLELTSKLLTDDALFVLISSYTTGFSKTIIKNCVINSIIKEHGGKVTSDEIGVASEIGEELPCGISTRWERC